MRASTRSIPAAGAARRGGALGVVCVAFLAIGAAPGIAATGDPGDHAAPGDGDGATRCVLQVTGLDRSGVPALRTLGLALDRSGLLAAPLQRLRQAAGRWTVLRVASDSGLPGADPEGIAITGLIEMHEDLDIAVLSAPGLPACPAAPLEGAPAGPLVGLRERIGYRPRLFRADIERAIRLPDGRDLLVVSIPDGGGAENGFLLADGMRLAGAILPPPVAADARLACALPVTSGELAGAGGVDRRPVLPLAAIGSEAPPAAGDGPIGRFATALLLSRVDQVDRALDMMQAAADGLGEFAGLLVERGTLQFRAGRSAAAIDDFAHAARLEPGLHVAHYNLGIALGSVGRYDEAAAALERAARISPGHARTIFHLALATMAAGHSSAIRRQYESLAAIDPALAVELKTLLGLE